MITLFSFYSLNFTTSLSTSNLTNGPNTVNCGVFQNLTYPFTGGDHYFYCGPPQFHINCINDTPELTIMSLTYRVLQLDSGAQTLRLARADLCDQNCTCQLTPIRINPSAFVAVVSVTQQVSSRRRTVKRHRRFASRQHAERRWWLGRLCGPKGGEIGLVRPKGGRQRQAQQRK